jgi:predicted MFS family arabinose efflux permease
MSEHPPKSKVLYLSFSLSIAAALSLGVTRFAYGLLLPPMRADLDWSYTTAGAMNTINAFGYFLGALSTPLLMRRWGAVSLLLFGAILSTIFMAGCGFYIETESILAMRFLSGVSSALIFVAGGLLSARLGSILHERAGLILGLYYGGTGTGIVLSALIVPIVLHYSQEEAHSWKYAWWALSILCGIFTLFLYRPMLELQFMGLHTTTIQKEEQSKVQYFLFFRALLGYGLFGVGYIGYMTFVIALLREMGVKPILITLFYTSLGLATIAGGKIWSRLLDRAKGGGALAILNGLLGFCVLVPALSTNPFGILFSGVLFGSIFLSVVASTTAFVRHNLNQTLWAKGISAFTIVFALGQILGPTIVGLIADGAGGVENGLVFSSISLWIGAALGWSQKKLVIEKT